MKVSEALISQKVVVVLKYSYSTFYHSEQQVLEYAFFSNEVVASNCFNTFLIVKLQNFTGFVSVLFGLRLIRSFFLSFLAHFSL